MQEVTQLTTVYGGHNPVDDLVAFILSQGKTVYNPQPDHTGF